MLQEIKESSKEAKVNLGPRDGIIGCGKDDSIEVRFNLFGEEVVGRALIKS